MARSTLAVAVAFEAVPFEAVAVMVQGPGDAGAVKTPEVEIEPHEADQLTG